MVRSKHHIVALHYYALPDHLLAPSLLALYSSLYAESIIQMSAPASLKLQASIEAVALSGYPWVLEVRERASNEWSRRRFMARSVGEHDTQEQERSYINCEDTGSKLRVYGRKIVVSWN
jgi:hypothetical protein